MSRGQKLPKRGPEVGYCKPPLHTRFQKGESGNPSGRPRGAAGVQAERLILKEAYRKVNVREGETVVTLPAIQAILRGLVVGAAKGNGPAQRAFIAAVQEIEHKMATREVGQANSETKTLAMSDVEIARRIAFVLTKPLMKRS